MLFKDSPAAAARPWHLEVYLSVCASLLLFGLFVPLNLARDAGYAALAVASGPALLLLARALRAAARPLPRSGSEPE